MPRVGKRARARQRRRYLNRGTAPLYWADPPATLLWALRARAQRAVQHISDASLLARRAHAEFYRLLDAEQIYVEGHTDLGGVRRGS